MDKKIIAIVIFLGLLFFLFQIVKAKPEKPPEKPPEEEAKILEFTIK